MRFLVIQILSLSIAVSTVYSLQCFYFPREFISHKDINSEALRKLKCSPENNFSSTWNEFLKAQINFLVLQQCITYNGTLMLSDACVSSINATLHPLFNNPLCRTLPEPRVDLIAWACIFEPLDPCHKSERAGPKNNVLSLLCKLKSIHHGKENEFTGALKIMGLSQKFLHFFTAGRFIDTPGQPHSPGSSIDKGTSDFLSNFRCTMYHGTDGNCCNGPSGCNLPPRLNQTSFYANVGANELLAAYAEDPSLRSYLASAAGVNDLWQKSYPHQAAGVSDHYASNKPSLLSASNGVITGLLCALAFACLALIFCLLGVCYSNRRNRLQKRRCSRGRDRLQASDGGSGCLNSVFKRGSSPPFPEDGTPPSGLSFSYGHHHGPVCGVAAANDSAAAEKLLSALATPSVSASSCGAFNCPMPVGVAGGDDLMQGHQQRQRMIAVPNKNHGSQPQQLGCGGSGGGGSSGVGTAGDSLPSTSWNSSCVVVPNCQPQPPEVLQRSTEGVIDSVDSQTGSGSGQPILLPRTIAREIEHRELIGQGRFGQVFRSVWRNDPVAVKIFSSRAESSWSTEGHIYELPGMRHDAILGFIAIDNIDIGVETQLWLITDYHANGSLQSYLTRCTVDQLTLARMLHSIASGLAYLHSEIAGVKCKPAIAHRDIKSNNILVKADLSCCIADFGLAVALQPGRGGTVVGLANGGIGALGVGSSAGDSGIGDVQLQQHKNKQQQQADNGIRVGTRRYLSPECLNGTQDAKDFTALRKADVYAAGLVFWELAARCHDPDRQVTAEQVYLQPYHGLVPANPTLEQMQAIVCSPSDARPPNLPGWLEHPVLGRLCRVMAECWYPSPAARLEAMSVKDQTARMLQTANQLQMASAAADGPIGTVVA